MRDDVFNQLADALSQGNTKIVLAKLPKIDETNSEGRTLLMEAARRLGPRACEWLLEQGASPLKTDFSRRTVLHFLVEGHARKELVGMFYSRGAPVNARDNLGLTAFEYGAKLHMEKGVDNVHLLEDLIYRWGTFDDKNGKPSIARLIVPRESFGPYLRNRAAFAANLPYPCRFSEWMKNWQEPQARDPWDGRK